MHECEHWERASYRREVAVAKAATCLDFWLQKQQLFVLAKE
jgi:hypothetical protein